MRMRACVKITSLICALEIRFPNFSLALKSRCARKAKKREAHPGITKVSIFSIEFMRSGSFRLPTGSLVPAVKTRRVNSHERGRDPKSARGSVLQRGRNNFLVSSAAMKNEERKRTGLSQSFLDTRRSFSLSCEKLPDNGLQ